MEVPGLIDCSFPYMFSINSFIGGSPAKKRMPQKIEATQGGNGMKRDRPIVFVTLRDLQKEVTFFLKENQIRTLHKG